MPALRGNLTLRRSAPTRAALSARSRTSMLARTLALRVLLRGPQSSRSLSMLFLRPLLSRCFSCCGCGSSPSTSSACGGSSTLWWSASTPQAPRACCGSVAAPWAHR
eukprot:Amastigsp_a853553_7.p3 type:complete len:107 gc:universal Amastigsp_a853553_7:558-238(-)